MENGDGNRYGNGEISPVGTEQSREQQVGEAGASRGGRRTAGKNRRTLVGHVYPYGTSYKWEGAD